MKIKHLGMIAAAILMLSGQANADDDRREQGRKSSYKDQPATAVPEPEVYTMMIAGVGLIGFAARRKLKAKKARSLDNKKPLSQY